MTERSLNRRGFIKGAGAALLARAALPAGAAIPFSLVAHTPAQAQAEAAAVVLGIQMVMQFATSFLAVADGTTLRYAALDAKLNGVLENQIRIMEGMQALNANITRLEETGRVQHRDERYLTRLVDAEEVSKHITTLSAELDALDKSRWDQPLYTRYQDLAFKTGSLIFNFESDLEHTQTGSKGVTSIIYAGAIVYLIAENLRKLGLMELRFPETVNRSGWVPSVYFKEIVGHFSSALSLLQTRYAEAHKEQVTTADSNYAASKETEWKFYTDKLLSGEGRQTKELCFAPEEWRSIPRVRLPPISDKRTAFGEIETDVVRLVFPPRAVEANGTATIIEEERFVLTGYKLKKFETIWLIKDISRRLIRNQDTHEIVSPRDGPDPTIGCAPISQTFETRLIKPKFATWINQLMTYSQATAFRLALETMDVGIDKITDAHKQIIEGRLLPELSRLWDTRSSSQPPAPKP